MRIIFPELDPIRRESEWQVTLRRLDLLESPSFELAMAALLKPLSDQPIVGHVWRRLKLSNDECDRIEWLVAHQQDLDDAPQLSLAALKRTLAHPYFEDLLKLVRADRIAQSLSLEPIVFCEDFLARTPAEVIDPIPFVTGDDLIALGLKPGPRFKSVLGVIRDAQLNLQITSRDEAMAMVLAEWDK
jgi:poly(A) polymerase